MEGIMETSVIATTSLHKVFADGGDVTAVDGIDLQVPEGAIYGFLGPNGAGKSTTIRMLLGLVRPTTGTIRLFGELVRPGGTRHLRRTGALIEAPSLYPHLTARENLELTRRLTRTGHSRIEHLLKTVDLLDAADRPAGRYSTGMRQRLGLALALMNDPELLILDEPTNGLDPAGIHEIRELIRRIPEELGSTVFLSSHHLGEVEQIASHVGIIHKGKLLYQGSLKDLEDRSRFVKEQSGLEQIFLQMTNRKNARGETV
jgi:ABC-type multidrug transport system ATPase subunit